VPGAFEKGRAVEGTAFAQAVAEGEVELNPWKYERDTKRSLGYELLQSFLKTVLNESNLLINFYPYPKLL